MREHWKNDKHFIVALGILFAAVVFALLWALPTFSQAGNMTEKTKHDQDFIKDSLGSADWQTAADVRAIEAEIVTLQDVYQRLKTQVAWLPDERFSLKSTDSDPLIYFSNMHEKVLKNIERAAARHNIGIPKTLNFREEEITAEAVPVLLKRLSVVEQLANLAIEAEVGAITQFVHGKDMDESTGFAQSQEGFVRGSFVLMEVQCHFNSLAALAHGTQRKGALLQFYKMTMEKNQAEGELMKATIVVRGVEVDEKAGVQETAATAEDGSGGSKWHRGR